MGKISAQIMGTPARRGNFREAFEQVQSPNLEPKENPLLVFNGLLVIVGGGALDLELLQELRAKGANVVAADGGANACFEANIIPDALIGDMDSVTDIAQWNSKTRVISIAEQSTTDFEKCLYSTQAPLTLAMGMTGKRLDHTLAALDSIARFAKTRRIILVDEEDVAMGLCGPVSFEVEPGDRVSVHPLQEVVFERSEGLKYSLNGLKLTPGVRTGTSNEAINGTFYIEPAHYAGTWLLILSKNYLLKLLETFLERTDI